MKQFEVISGHLTTTNKKHLKTIIGMGVNDAKVNRINYNILSITNDGLYTVIVISKDSYNVSGIDKSKVLFYYR
jgi:hypothetical protein